MVKSPYECTYCGIIDNRGLYSSIDMNNGALCRDCYDSIPQYIDYCQWNKWLRAKMREVKCGK